MERPIKMVYSNIYEPRIKSDTSLNRYANQYTVTFSLDLTKFLEQLCTSEVNTKIHRDNLQETGDILE